MKITKNEIGSTHCICSAVAKEGDLSLSIYIYTYIYMYVYKVAVQTAMPSNITATKHACNVGLHCCLGGTKKNIYIYIYAYIYIYRHIYIYIDNDK